MTRVLGLGFLVLLAGWAWEHPSPTGATFEAASARASVVHAVGQRGVIAISRDGGAAWQMLASPVTADLHAVAESAAITIAVGDRGTIVRSKDGDHFDARRSGVTAPLIGVAIGARAIVALADDGTIVRSTDGGETFARFAARPGGMAIAIAPSGSIVVGARDGLYVDGTRVATDPAQSLAIAGDGSIHALAQTRVVYRVIPVCNACVDHDYRVAVKLSSKDGATWTRTVLTNTPATPPAAPPAGSYIHGPFAPPRVEVDPRHGSLVVDAAGAVTPLLDRAGAVGTPAGALAIAPLAVSVDRGATWRDLIVRQTSGEIFALAATATRVFAIGSDATLLVRDAGSWASKALPIDRTQRLAAIATAGDTVIVVGDGGIILQSTDNGTTWKHRASDRIDDLRAVTAIGNDVFAAGHDALLRSRDRGATWDSVAWSDPNVTALWAASATELYALGSSVMRSTDRGATWTAVAAIDRWSTEITGDGPDRYIAAHDGTLFVSHDAGASWKPTALGATTVNHIWARGAEVAIAASIGLLRSHDRGATWSTDPLPTPAPLRDVSAVGSTLYVAATGAQILRGAL